LRGIVRELDVSSLSREIHRAVLTETSKKEICKGLLDHLETVEAGKREGEFSKISRFLNTTSIMRKDSFTIDEWSRIVSVYRRATVLWYATAR